MKRRQVLGVGTLAIAAHLGPLRAQQAPQKLRFGVDQFVIGSQVWVALEKGFFQRNGVDAQVTPFATGVDTLDAVLTERLDFGLGFDFATLPRLQTGQMKLLSAIAEPLPGFHKLAVRKSIAKPADLAGKRIGVARGTAQHLMTIKYLENAAGLPPSAVTLVPLPSLIEIIAALRSDRIDAAFVWGDGTNQAGQIADVVILGDDTPANLRAFGFLATRKRLMETQPAAVDAALKALIEATDWMDSNADEAAAIVAAKARAPLENVRRLIPSQHFTMSLKPAHLTGLQNIATFAAELGLTKVVVDAKQHIDTSFLRRVAPPRVTMVL